MKVEGKFTFDAPRATVWESLLSQEVLIDCIPGCQECNETGKDAYDVVMRVGVASVSGTYTGKVTIVDRVELESFKMIVEGRGSGGSVKGEGLLSFSDDGNGGTLVSVVGDARVTGIVARVGQRLMGNASKLLMNQFFECLRSKVNT